MGGVVVVRLRRIASGYGLLEGPRVDAQGNLHFADVTNGGVYRRAADGSVTTVVAKRRGVGGIALHADGGLVISGRDVCHVRDGTTRILFERPDGVGGFNDLFTDAEGRVYAGALRSNPFGEDAGRSAGELYRIEGENMAVELYGDVRLSNGIGFSPDGRILYHSDTAAGHIIAHDVAEDGAVSGRRVFTRVAPGAPDGLAVDEAGAVWVACYGGGCVARYAPGGRLDRRLEVPARGVASLCFGGSDRRDLYVVTADSTDDANLAGSILATRVEVPGLPVPPARI